MEAIQFIPNNKDFQTPKDVADYMASLIWHHSQTFLEPTPGAGNLVKALMDIGKDCIEAPTGDYWKFIHSISKYDTIIMNPPFTPMSNCIRFVDEAMKRSDEVIALLPWLYLINSDIRMKKIMDFGLKSVTYLPRNTFPSCRVQVCIIHMNKRHKGGTEFIRYQKPTTSANQP